MKFHTLLLSFFLLSSTVARATELAGTGVGLTVGSPSGIAGRTWLNGENSVAYGLGWGLLEGNKLQVYADYLWSRPHSFELNQEKFDFFFGGGLGVRSKSGSNGNELVFGPRLPVGVSYWFSHPDLELFAQAALNVGVIPSSDVYVDLLLGARFYLF